MEYTKLNREELTKRASEVFDLREKDEVYDVYVADDGQVAVRMLEYVAWQDDYVDFKYLPDMSGRPQATDYLLGKRDDFND